MTITIRQLVNEYLPEDAPPDLTLAMIELLSAARTISDARSTCTACLLFAVADLVDKALDAGKIGHEGDGEEEGEEEEVKVPTHAEVPIIQ
jgi:hypothetical protein